MAKQTGRFAWISGLARAGLIVALVLIALALAGTIATAILVIIAWLNQTAPIAPQWSALGAFVLTAIGLAAAALWLCACYGVVRVLVSMNSSCEQAVQRVGRVESLLEKQGEFISKLTDLAALSDRAKSLIFRDHEIEAMREAIHEDLIRQDYNSAEALIESVEKTLGYEDEAKRLRQEVEQSRKATLDEKIDAAVNRIKEIISRHDWARALRESHRLLNLFPENPKIASLPERIRSAKAQRKRDLLQAYGEAVRKNDVDRSIELLKELDSYLTPQEGAALQESARGVFKARLHQLGVQFAISVTDMDWNEAISAGETIVSEYPNTRMAQEVREKMDLLKARAAQGEGEAPAAGQQAE